MNAASRIFCLSPDEIDSTCHEWLHHLERLERETGVVLASAVLADLQDGTKHLWGTCDAAESDPKVSTVGGNVKGIVLTSIERTPKGLACLIYGACGQTTSQEVNQVLSTIETWARNIGCTRLQFQGRKGWLRLLKDFRQTGITAEKLL